MAMGEGLCRYCGRKVLWGRTTKGKLMPIDPGQVEKGNLLLEGEAVRVVAIGAGTHRPHWVSCRGRKEAA